MQTHFKHSPNIPCMPTLASLITNSLLHQNKDGKSNNNITNEVPDNIKLYANEEIVLIILDKLLSIVTTYDKSSRIKIYATEYHDIIIIHIKSCGTVTNNSLLQESEELMTLANGLGGILDVMDTDNGEVNIAFTLLNIRGREFLANNYKFNSHFHQ